MFDSKLFEKSEKAFRKIDRIEYEIRCKEMEKRVVEIIKSKATYIDENGIAIIIVKSTDYFKGDNSDYDVLRSIITNGRKKYFEDEYSLYFVSDESIYR